MEKVKDISNPWDMLLKEGTYNLQKPEPNLLNILKASERVDAFALDLGCGQGRHLAPLQDKGFQPIGLDISPSAIQDIRSMNPDLPVIIGDMKVLPFEDERLDLVLAWRSVYLQSFKEMLQSVDEIKRTLKPGGKLIAAIRSTRNTLFFIGKEKGVKIEENTFLIDDDKHLKGVIFHFSHEQEIRDVFSWLTISYLKEEILEDTKYTHQDGRPSTNYYWIVVGEKPR
jgi:SAM-dependent methyltransferase